MVDTVTGQGWKTRSDLLTVSEVAEEKWTTRRGGKARTTRALEARRQHAQERLAALIALPEHGDKPTLEWIKASDIRFDERYQPLDRRNEKRARDEIAVKFDWNRFDPLVLNQRPGDPSGAYWAPDGWHRWRGAAIRFGPDVLIPARVHRVPYEQEALIFARQGDGRRQVPKAMRFDALLQGDDRESDVQNARALKDVLDKHGVKLAKSAAVRTCTADSLITLAQSSGLGTVDLTLTILLDKWKGGADSLQADFVKGLGRFFAKWQDHTLFKIETFRKALYAKSVEDVNQIAGYQRAGKKPDKIARAFHELYNRVPFKRNRLPIWDDR